MSHIERQQLCNIIDSFCDPSRRPPDALGPRLAYLNLGKSRSEYLTALMVLLPNISHLDIYDSNSDWYPCLFYSGKDLPFWLKILGAAALGCDGGISPGFRHLRQIRIRMGPLRLEHISKILLLPTLRTLILVNILHEGDVDPLWWHCTTGASPIEVLALECSLVDSKAVATLISSMRALRDFELTFDPRLLEGPGEGDDNASLPKLHYPTLTGALEKHKSSLERILIDDDSGALLSPIEHSERGHFGCLCMLDRVTTLSASMSAFANGRCELANGNSKREGVFECLPPSLTHLTLGIGAENRVQADGPWLAEVEGLASSCRARLPALQMVVVYEETWEVLSPNYTGPIMAGVERVRDMFAGQGVAFELHTYLL
ncbi:hypothetical protein K505DRAFT_343768 [Melanomma pulvis-pyrius CBS 109.77]|uniref:F-box domain-containing protein n=1 Tax=Melanomma pulvis-pyrius CBS 109.77 TaxID=1314802 RepID=A0A6A6WR90_9PLEO|nr:hypothetical protein K505DRAFT_343768 [Melanomma pulvis-pyrius CBS 109.77]